MWGRREAEGRAGRRQPVARRHLQVPSPSACNHLFYTLAAFPAAGPFILLKNVATSSGPHLQPNWQLYLLPLSPHTPQSWAAGAAGAPARG